MAHIFVNGISAKSGGGKSILTNFLTVLSSQGSHHKFTVLVPDTNSYQRFISDNLRIISFPFLSKQALFPFTTIFVLPRLIRKLGCDLIFNPADLPVPTDLPQLFLFDWPYAAYPQSSAWQLGSSIDKVKRHLKYYLFLRYIRYIDIVIAQGPALRSRLMDLYDFAKISIVPNAVSLDNLDAVNHIDFKLGKGFKLLCLTRYYSHKNLEILLELGELIRFHNLNWLIIITISKDQGLGAKVLLENIKSRNLDHIIQNVGPVDMRDVPALYRQTDALLLPTLLESFSGTYVEAMFHGKPIFTSDYEFAIDVCQDSAFYFDPLNVNQILEVIIKAVENPNVMELKATAGYNRLAVLPNWHKAFDAYMSLIDSMLDGINDKPPSYF